MPTWYQRWRKAASTGTPYKLSQMPVLTLISQQRKQVFKTPIEITVSRASREAIKAVEGAGGKIMTRFFNKNSIRAVVHPERYPNVRLANPTARKDIEYYRDPEHRGYLAHTLDEGESRVCSGRRPGRRRMRSPRSSYRRGRRSRLIGCFSLGFLVLFVQGNCIYLEMGSMRLDVPSNQVLYRDWVSTEGEVDSGLQRAGVLYTSIGTSRVLCVPEALFAIAQLPTIQYLYHIMSNSARSRRRLTINPGTTQAAIQSDSSRSHAPCGMLKHSS